MPNVNKIMKINSFIFYFGFNINENYYHIEIYDAMQVFQKALTKYHYRHGGD